MLEYDVHLITLKGSTNETCCLRRNRGMVMTNDWFLRWQMSRIFQNVDQQPNEPDEPVICDVRTNKD